MATTSSRTLTPDRRRGICILYGFCEGRHLAKPALGVFEAAGYRIVHDPKQADTIIAHSGGWYLLPKGLADQHIIIVGPTYWSGKSIVRALIQKNRNDFRLHRGDRNLRTWLRKFSWNVIYFWNMPNNLRMLHGRKGGTFWHAKNVTLVRNREDSFCTPDLASLPFVHPPRFIELPGQHDDIWLHPRRYVYILEQL